MRVQHPFDSYQFEVPDLWLTAAGAHDFKANASHYRFIDDPKWPARLVDVSEVAAPRRRPGVPGLVEARAVALLRAMASGDPIPPIEVHCPPESEARAYAVRDGFHRYHLSIALGFSLLPVSVRPYFDLHRL